MENTYGIGVTNRYSLFLDEEEDPLEFFKAQELQRESKRKSKILDKESKPKNAEQKPAPIRKAVKDTKNAKVASTKPTETANSKDELANTKVAGLNKKNGKFVSQDNREDRNNRRNLDEKSNQTTSFSINRDTQREGHGRGSRSDTTFGTRDGPREGFGRGFRNGLTNLPREGFGRGSRYDTTGLREGQSHGPRNDMTGEDRRERGMGPRGSASRGRSYRGMHGNRGSYDNRVKRNFFQADKIELPDSLEAPSNEWEAEPPAPTELVAGEAIVAPAGLETVETRLEEEPHELTLDEYKALRGSRQKPTYNLRKAGEGEDLSRWDNMYELSKKKEDEEPDEEDAAEYDVLEYPQRVGRQRHILNIDIHFTDGRRGSRGRGGRGAPRGSRVAGPRGGGRSRTTRPDESPRVPRGRGDHQEPAFRGERFTSERGFQAEGEPPEQFGGGLQQSAPKVDDVHDFPSLG